MEIKVPQVGESIVEAEVGEWFKQDGEYVTKDDLLLELETEKINVELNADASGKLSIQAQTGDTVKIGAVIGTIDENAAAPEPAKESSPADEREKSEEKPEEKPQQKSSQKSQQETSDTPAAPQNPAVAKIAAERGVDPQTLKGSGRDGRVLVDDIPTQAAQATSEAQPETAETEKTPPEAGQSTAQHSATERVTRVPMTQIRKKIAAHLLKARQETAMLTTFNEADMSRVLALRQQYKESFQDKHGIGLGFMSFFIKACAAALSRNPEVNAQIDGDDIVYHNYYDIGIAVGSKRGLVVPVIRDADQLNFADIEATIRDFVERANSGKLTMEDLEGGTFTISNGGIYGSVLSTPLLNPPQSGILGMHAIQDRAVVRDGEIVIRPIMNIALSYDHRIIDGQQAVIFLKQVKTYIEQPETLLLDI
jgi:2-oxoglutarate dehydrogenase E2 component (dihydrolipoamide succinyltransferase)